MKLQVVVICRKLKQNRKVTMMQSIYV